VFLAASDQLKEARPVVLALGALAQADAGPMALGIDWSPLAGRGEPLLAPLRSEHQDLQQLLGRGELRAALPAIATLSRKHLILAAAVARLGPSVSMAARWGGMARRLEAAGGASYTPPEELGGRCPEAWRRAETGDLEHWEAELSAVAADLDRRASAAQELLALDEELLSELQAWDSTVPLSVVGAGGQQLALAREQVRLAAAERDEILRETCTGPLAVALSAPARLRAAHEALRTTLGALDLARPQLVASGPEPGTYVRTALPEIWLQFDEALSRITIEGIEMELDAERRTGRLRLELGEGRDSIPYCATDLVGNESRDELPIKIVAVLVPPWAELVAERPDPAVVTDAEGRRRMEETGLAWKVRDRVSGIAMHLVPPGIYMRGASPDDPDPDGDEVPAHQVQVSSPFYLGETEVTNQQWATIAGTEAPAGEKANLPASGLSYEEIVAVLEPIGLRLPREAEWEYACRAGSILMHYGSLEEIGWTRSNSELTLRPVGQLRANAWGFKDMIGSVWEWCSTCYRADRYATLASRPMPLDARVDDEIQYLEDSWELVLRGGCWWEYSRDASASGRMGSYSFERWGVGCRVARDP
jgi:formylglycine-generating enzyme required for sulfatase activity